MPNPSGTFEQICLNSFGEPILLLIFLYLLACYSAFRKGMAHAGFRGGYTCCDHYLIPPRIARTVGVGVVYAGYRCVAPLSIWNGETSHSPES